MASSGRLWRAVGVAGELLLTLGLVLLLFVVYLLWWTNQAAARAAAAASEQLRQQWAAGPTPMPSPTVTSTASQAPSASPTPVPTPTQSGSQPAVGATIGLVYIPRLRSDVWGLPLVQGVEATQLAQGLGHYPGTALPGQIGNFAAAGHRATHGEPLRNVDQLRQGDVVIVETQDTWFTYELDRYQIVMPEDVWVIDPVPGQPPGTPSTQALMTLTSCHPRWASTQRFIWWGQLVQTTAKSSGAVPEELQ